MPSELTATVKEHLKGHLKVTFYFSESINSTVTAGNYQRFQRRDIDT